jgi:DNA-binding MarR family transcriptional regulator
MASLTPINLWGYHLINGDTPILNYSMPSAISTVPPDRCNNTALKKASRKLSQVYDDTVAPTGLKSTQVSVLFEIDRWNEAPPTMKDLAAALVMDRSTLGQNLRPLERDGLIALEEHPSDARSKHVVLTRAGKKKVAEAAVLWSQAQKRFEKIFGTKEAEALRTVLLAIANSSEL